MTSQSPPRGRPQIWPTQIQAPQSALDLYAAIANLHNSDAFDVCHIWSGSLNGSQPIVKWQKKNKGVVQVLAGYMGLPTSKNTCGNKSCVNPFHYLPYAAPDAQFNVPSAPTDTFITTITASIEDYIELVEDVINKYTIRKDEITFDHLRRLIPQDDITDAYLQEAINHLT